MPSHISLWLVQIDEKVVKSFKAFRKGSVCWYKFTQSCIKSVTIISGKQSNKCKLPFLKIHTHSHTHFEQATRQTFSFLQKNIYLKSLRRGLGWRKGTIFKRRLSTPSVMSTICVWAVYKKNPFVMQGMELFT